MSLKFLRRKGGGRRMWRSPGTMATGKAASWAFDPRSSAQTGLSGMGCWFQVCRERRALLPAHKPNICSDQPSAVPCPQICPRRGWSWAELPAAVSFHLRGQPHGREGTQASGPSSVHSCGETGSGEVHCHLGPE